MRQILSTGPVTLRPWCKPPQSHCDDPPHSHSEQSVWQDFFHQDPQTIPWENTLYCNVKETEKTFVDVLPDLDPHQNVIPVLTHTISWLRIWRIVTPLYCMCCTAAHNTANTCFSNIIYIYSINGKIITEMTGNVDTQKYESSSAFANEYKSFLSLFVLADPSHSQVFG